MTKTRKDIALKRKAPDGNTIRLIRASYWAGAILDLLAFLIMLFPTLFALNYGMREFNPGIDFRYAMGMGAPLMLGWTVLLIWADRSPLERRDILWITLLVVLGEVIAEVFGVQSGFLEAAAVIPTLIIQFLLSLLFIVSYRKAIQ